MFAALVFAALVFAALALWFQVPAFASTPPCVARASLDPDSAVVGQQILWKVQIDSRDDVEEISWVDTPAFANVRTERLPGLPTVAATRDTPPRYTTREEHRALFAERTGTLPIETAGLQCRLRSGVVLDIAVPAVALRVRPLPPSAPDFSGVVGPLVLQSHVDPDELVLGQTLHVTVSVRGSGNLWDVSDPLAGWRPPLADVFARKPQLDLRAGRRLSVQKIFRYDVVPRSAGPLSVPSVSLAHFDPIDARYFVAQSRRLDIVVLPGSREPDARAAAERSGQTAHAEDHGFPSRTTFAIALIAIPGLTIVWVLWRRNLRSRSAAIPMATDDAEHDAAQWARALRSALALRGVSIDLDRDSIASAAPARSDAVSEAAAVLETLERSRFDPHTEAPAPEAIRRALEGLDGA